MGSVFLLHLCAVAESAIRRRHCDTKAFENEKISLVFPCCEDLKARKATSFAFPWLLLVVRACACVCVCVCVCAVLPLR